VLLLLSLPLLLLLSLPLLLLMQTLLRLLLLLQLLLLLLLRLFLLLLLLLRLFLLFLLLLLLLLPLPLTLPSTRQPSGSGVGSSIHGHHPVTTLLQSARIRVAQIRLCAYMPEVRRLVRCSPQPQHLDILCHYFIGVSKCLLQLLVYVFRALGEGTHRIEVPLELAQKFVFGKDVDVDDLASHCLSTSSRKDNGGLAGHPRIPAVVG